ncbi:SusC/RagA family TonB-linked outer membrane protein [Bacteroidales bacterium]|nr:SusC/RagA family TonB-linked outer membrane protein [Bacteroidales bacterium]
MFLLLLVGLTSGKTYALPGLGAESGVFASAQQSVGKIEGRVVDANGEPLLGLTVVLKGTSIGTVTDMDGRYSLNVGGNENPRLIFSYIGMKSQEIVANKSKLDVVMQDDLTMMDEVVVVGYGVQKKVNLTGAVASVDVEKTLGSRPIADIGRGLQGAVPGLSVVIPNGEVGAEAKMRIRGSIASIEGTSNPLILVDNVEVASIQMINPNDVQDISILKDAASTSIYGAKGAFGVILITTKKGSKTEGFTVSYNSNVSWQTSARKIDLAGIDGLQYTLDAHRNRLATDAAGGFWRVDESSIAKIREWQAQHGSSVSSSDPVLYGRDWVFDASRGGKFGYRIYDPVEEMVKEWTPTESHNLTASGRSGKTVYNISLGYMHQNGMMKPAKHDDFTRYNTNMSISSEISKVLTVRSGFIYSDRNKRSPSSYNAHQGADPWLYLYRYSRLFPMGVSERDKDLMEPVFEARNATTDNFQNKYMSINLGATINFTKNWDLMFDYTYANAQNISNQAVGQVSVGDMRYNPIAWRDANGNQVYVDDMGNVTSDGGMPAYTFPVIQNPAVNNSHISNRTTLSNKGTFNIYTTYNLKLNNSEQHVFKFMAGMNRVTGDSRGIMARRGELINNENPQFAFAIGEDRLSNFSPGWDAVWGVFGRANYTLDSKYMLEANLRYDGSSKFPSHLQWKYYPSFSAGWIATNEKFMKALDPVLSFAKFRASWGTIGDQSVSNGLYIPSLNGYKTGWLTSDGKQPYAFGTPSIVDRNISWQDIEHKNIAVDMRFLKDKLGLTAELFQRDTKNMIVDASQLPHTLGVASPKGNYGNIRTNGWEVALDFNHRFRNGLSVNASASLADWTTKITKGPDSNIAESDRLLNDTYRTGKRYGDIYGYVSDRLYQTEDFLYDDKGNIRKTTIIINGVAKETNMLAANNPVYQTRLEDGGGIILFNPGDMKYVDANGDGYITDGDRTVGNPGDLKVIGNSEPRYEYSFRLGADYKGFDASVLFTGIGKRDIWGAGQLAIAGYNAKEGAMPQAIASNYWREDRTDAFYPRAFDLNNGNTGYSMQIQSRYLLNMAYLRMKNITLGYSVQPNVLKKVQLSKARFYVSLENFLTFDNLNGLPIDPEAITGSGYSGSGYNLNRTGNGAPIFKSASLGVQLSF